MKKKLIGIVIGIMLLIPVSLASGNNREPNEKMDIENNYQSMFTDDINVLLYKQPGSPGVNLDIQNIGTTQLTNIAWDFRYKTSILGKGLLLNEKSHNGIINELEPGETQTFTFSPLSNEMTSPLGFGDIYLNASAGIDSDLARTQYRSFLVIIFLAAFQETYMDISPSIAYDMMLKDMFDMIIDVSPHYEDRHLPGSVNYYIGDGSLDNAIPTLDKNLNYLVYCHVDSASVPGAQKLVDAGITNVYRLEGNFQAWVDAGYPIAEESGYIDVTAKQAKDLIDNKSDLIIIDVSPFYDDGHIPGAINYYIGDGSLDAAIPLLDKDKEYLVYCHADSASISGATKLVNAQFNPVYRLEGNLQAWVDAGYPIE